METFGLLYLYKPLNTDTEPARTRISSLFGRAKTTSYLTTTTTSTRTRLSTHRRDSERGTSGCVAHEHYVISAGKVFIKGEGWCRGVLVLWEPGC